MKSGARGATLIEVLVGGALILGILSATVAILLACYRHHRETEAAVAVHESALKALTLLERELKDSSEKCVAEVGSPTGLVFATPMQANGTMTLDSTSKRPVWQRWIAYYLQPAGERFRLIRKEESISSPSDVLPTLEPSHNTAHFAALSGGSVIARSVKEFEVSVGSTVDIYLVCDEIVHKGTSTQAEFAVKVATKVTPRN